jgi:hypothetical protein
MKNHSVPVTASWLYTKIIDFYLSPRDQAQTDIWTSHILKDLMDLYKNDPGKIALVVRNAILLIVNLFTAAKQEGVDGFTDEIPSPVDLDLLRKELQELFPDL